MHVSSLPWLCIRFDCMSATFCCCCCCIKGSSTGGCVGGGGGGKLGGMGKLPALACLGDMLVSNGAFVTITLLVFKSFVCCMSGTTVDSEDIFGLIPLGLLLTGRVRVLEGDMVVIVVMWGGVELTLLFVPLFCINGDGDEDEEDEEEEEVVFEGKSGSLGSMNVVERELWSTKKILLLFSYFISQPAGSASLALENMLRNLTSSLLCWYFL